jgi:AAA+ superfamily predicted ATPase
VVAATNHPQMLDRALYRRFDLVIEYGLPDRAVAVEVIQKRLTLLDTAGVEWDTVGADTRDLSHADLVRAAEAAAKHVLLSGNTRLTTKAIVASLRERRREGDD